MNFRQSNLRRSLLAAAGAALLMNLPAPALALDDGEENLFTTLSNLVGLTGLGFGEEETKPKINYRERAPLVLPPDLSHLPPPAPAVSQRSPAWPEDYDARLARESAERARRSAGVDTMANTRYSRDEMMKGRIANGARDPAAEACDDTMDPLGRACDPNKFWADLKKPYRPASEASKDIVAGQEPKRKALTDPPVGYRTPTKSVKYTFEVKPDIDMADPRAQMREEARREAARRSGIDPNQ